MSILEIKYYIGRLVEDNGIWGRGSHVCSSMFNDVLDLMACFVLICDLFLVSLLSYKK